MSNYNFATHYEYLITGQNLSRISNLLSTAGRQNKSFNTSRIYLSYRFHSRDGPFTGEIIAGEVQEFTGYYDTL